jgi:hypothetical protein
VGRVIGFPNRPMCPPHDWVSIYDEEVGGIDGPDGETVITGRVCVKCSLIESRESLALQLSGGKGQGLLTIVPYSVLG